MNENKRIAKNSLYLYMRMFMLMIIALYTSRIFLNALGFVDFGIYGVVGSMVSMFSFLTYSLSDATQRFVIKAVKEERQQMETFSNVLLVHLALAAVIFVVIEIAGIYFLHFSDINIPPERMNAASVVFQISLLMSLLTMLSSPYRSVIVANEKFQIYSYVSIVEALMKLGISYLISISTTDRLVEYAWLMFLSQVIVQAIYMTYCHRNYFYVRLRLIVNKGLLKEISNILGWSSIGYVAYTMVGQGLGVIGNMFYGPILNAALGVGGQMQGVLTQFRSNFQTAINPQITKCYFAKDYARMQELVNASAKYSIFILWIFLLPLCLQMPTVLHLWLGEYPPYTIELSYVLFFLAMVSSFGNPFSVAITSIGKLRGFTLITSAVSFSSLLISYCLLREYDNRLIPWLVYSVCATINLGINVYRVKRDARYSVMTLLRTVLLPIAGVVAVSFCVSYGALSCVHIDHEFASLVVSSAIVAVLTLAVIYAIGLKRTEKQFIVNIIQTKILRHE